jgi:hypothetical protein
LGGVDLCGCFTILCIMKKHAFMVLVLVIPAVSAAVTGGCSLRTSGILAESEEAGEDGAADGEADGTSDGEADGIAEDMPRDTAPDPAADEPHCPPGETWCMGECVDTDWDPAHCGACGNACAAGLHCCEGFCRECCNESHCDDGEQCTVDICDGGSCRHDEVANMQECGGGTGVCCWGVCRIRGECCVDGDCAGSEGSCAGAPPSCDTYYYYESSCNTLHGCYWSGPPGSAHCNGTSVACSAMRERCEGCGCTWNGETGECEGAVAVICGLIEGYPDDCEPCKCAYPDGPPPSACYEPIGYGCHLFSCTTQENCLWTGPSSGTCSGFTCI